MARAIVLIGALLAFVAAGVGLAAYRSDIQLIFAAVGLFAGLILMGIFFVLGRLDRHWNFLIDIEERLDRDRQN